MRSTTLAAGPASRRPNRASALGCVLLAAACSSASSPEAPCASAGVRVTVATDVVFSWSDCTLSSLVVSDAFGASVWAIEGTFTSPVTYGIVPSGASESKAPEPLEAGRGYTVLTASGDAVAFADFVR